MDRLGNVFGTARRTHCGMLCRIHLSGNTITEPLTAWRNSR